MFDGDVLLLLGNCLFMLMFFVMFVNLLIILLFYGYVIVVVGVYWYWLFGVVCVFVGSFVG